MFAGIALASAGALLYTQLGAVANLRFDTAVLNAAALASLAPSFALGIARCRAKRKQKGEIELRKYTTRTPTQLTYAEGNTDNGDSASLCWSGVVEGPRHA